MKEATQKRIHDEVAAFQMVLGGVWQYALAPILIVAFALTSGFLLYWSVAQYSVAIFQNLFSMYLGWGLGGVIWGISFHILNVYGEREDASLEWTGFLLLSMCSGIFGLWATFITAWPYLIGIDIPSWTAFTLIATCAVMMTATWGLLDHRDEKINGPRYLTTCYCRQGM